MTYQGRGLSHLALHNVIKDTAQKVNVKDAHIHKFRHFYSVQTINAGMDLNTLSKLLGHSSVLVTEEYQRSMTTAEKEKSNFI
ncbi:tyrosine-type recombinase/integrase [Sporosarcina highlanderae]|uniref:tyrosine-type recombinase/integrase n=1 Tax=Sporosarcina highlanderae TaxID=3035916 RepID=UPI0034359D7D